MNLRAWQACDTYKKAVYRLCEERPLCRDWKLRGQLQDSVAGPPAHLAEGFGRFNPPDFARYAVIARSSLMESQNHLHDAVDRRHITEERQRELTALAEAAIKEVTGLMEYLQSPEALRNARLARERRIATREQRRRGTAEHGEPQTKDEREPNVEREPEHEPEREPEHEPEHEPSTENREE